VDGPRPQEEELQRAARALEHIEAEAYLQDTDFGLPEETLRLVRDAPVELLERLLAHEDGRVRTLALAGLSLELGPRALPYLVSRVDDEGAAPPRRLPMAMIRPGPLPTEPQTVGAIARRVVELHLEAAGYRGGVEGRNGARGFDAYWEERRDRAHCLSWWRIALGRASRSSIPTPPDRLDAIAALRREIDLLPAVDRSWVLLALCAPWEGGIVEPGGRELASEEELVAAARVLSERGLLLALLRGEGLGSTDPGVRLTEPTAFPYERVVPFVLRHAPELLPTEVADELRVLELRHLSGAPVGEAPRCITSSWSIAAADLQPAHARETLHRALQLHARGGYHHDQDQRCYLVQALWRHCGSDELATIVDWFFDEEPGRGAFGFGRHRFADWLGDPEHGEVLRAILLERRLAELDWQSLERLARAANASSGREVVSARELRDTSHPLGQGHYHWSTPEERGAHPERSEALETTLARWRELLAEWARS
jgi:hypothetical protein